MAKFSCHRVKDNQNMQCYTKSLSQLQQLLLPKLRTANHLTGLLPSHTSTRYLQLNKPYLLCVM